MARGEPPRSGERARGMFSRVRAGDEKGIAPWLSGPRFIAVCLAGGAVLALTVGREAPAPDGRKAGLERAAEQMNGALLELRPFHARIAASPGGDLVLLDARWDACLEAIAPAGRLAALDLARDAQGKAGAQAEEVRATAARFVDAVKGCPRAGDAAAPAARVEPTCILRCMRGWSSLAGAAETLRADAAWVGVRTEPIAPPAASAARR